MLRWFPKLPLHDLVQVSSEGRGMIIKKGVEWSVDYDGRNASPGSKEDDPFTIEEANAPER